MECDYHIILLYQVSQHNICILWIQNTSICEWLYSDDTHEGQILWGLKCCASQKLKKKNNHCKGIFLRNMTENIIDKKWERFWPCQCFNSCLKNDRCIQCVVELQYY